MAKNQFFGNLRSSPRWAGDYLGPARLMPHGARIDPTQFVDGSGVRVVVGAAGAAIGATSVPVAALTPGATASTIIIAGGNVLIPSGVTLDFGGGKFARLTVDAKVGDTALTVTALPTALVSGDTAVYSPLGTEMVPSGTVLGRTFAEQTSSTPYGAAVNTDDQIYIQAFDCVNARDNPDVELVRPRAVIKANYLPGYGAGLPLGTFAAPTALFTKLLGIYECIMGVD
jgi:hypothetical protein